ncbi:PAS domain S-box-containing protein [Lutimaribacter pacificus]|uniref:histidine kinase n=1 Tax=Lutimaribacter pacificus TaxID=391948 RepID=A0A1H0ER20_9RHOB|nr:ATP-binding protein [Lutimaribacter pacificus]SDN84812.1 PAS domain S-box-containing protein [Lutimaribacter pacificus]SHK40204.1 PAS domain S-box-containing protein [Lutimaribacter pacificus]
MPDFKTRLRRLRRGWMPISVLLAGIALLVAVGLSLGWRGTQEMRLLADSQSDELIWTVTQAEVEFLEFERVILRQMMRGDGDAAALRDAFDVYYSRLTTLRVSPLYRDYIEAAGQRVRLAELGVRSDALLPLIDADDATLLAGADRLLVSVDGMRRDLRRLGSRVMQTVAQRREEMRKGIYAVMRDLAIVVVALLASMGVLSLLVWRLFRFLRARAREMRQTSTRLSTIVTTSQDAIVVTDDDDRITEFNAAAEALFGLGRAVALGQPIGRLCDVAALDGQVRRQRVTGFRREGREVPLEASLGVEGTPFGRIRVYVFRDITHRLAIEEDLRQSRDQALAGERAKARFLAVMSHEMRTPLNGIIGAIGLLRDEVREPRARQYLDILESSGETLLSHVNDVLDITQLEAANVALARQVVDLDALSHSVLRGFEPAARARGVRLERMVHMPGSPLVRGDRARLRQILTNLVDNAVKHTSDGTVTLDVSGGGPGTPLVEIQVSDTGTGIAPGDRGRIFEDFVRLERDDTVAPAGTGLGLGITRRLVEAMGGEIGVESEPGEGSLFWVRLPLPAMAAEAVAADPVTESGDSRIAPLRVLVVEDNPVNRFILREMLEKDGHLVDEAENGAAGLELADRSGFDLILMDIAMPGMDGDAVTRRIRAGGGPNAATRIVALTAHVQAAENPETRAAGFDQVVTKPVTWPVLRAVLRGQAAPVTPPPGTLPLLDTQAPVALQRSLGPGKYAAFLRDFRAGGAELLRMLDSGDTPPDPLRRKIHALAGMAAIVGARRLHGALSDLETALAGGQDTAAPAAGIAPLFADTAAALPD